MKRRGDPILSCTSADEWAVVGDPVREAKTNLHSQFLKEISQLLDPSTGFNCLAKFWREQIWCIVKDEPERVIIAYRQNHLAFLNRYIEPLARDPRQGGHAGFAKLCRELADSPNLAYVAARLGCPQPTMNTNVTAWFAWATEKENPSACLYCVAGFVAVPPYGGDVPVPVEGAVKTLTATSLVGLGEHLKAREIAEAFLRVSQSDYDDVTRLRDVLSRSPLREPAIVPWNKLVESLIEALRVTSDRGLSQATNLAEAYRLVSKSLQDA